MWHPQLGCPRLRRVEGDGGGAAAAPIYRTIAETLAWDRDRGLPELKAGMTAEKERELLDAWRASGS